MKRVLVVLVSLAAIGCGGDDEGGTTEAEAIAVVESEWGDCLTRAGESMDGASAEDTLDEGDC